MQNRVSVGAAAQEAVAQRLLQMYPHTAIGSIAAPHTHDSDVVMIDPITFNRVMTAEVKSRAAPSSSITLLSFSVSATTAMAGSGVDLRQHITRIFSNGVTNDFTVFLQHLTAQGLAAHYPQQGSRGKFPTIRCTDQVTLKWLQELLVTKLADSGNNILAMYTKSTSDIALYSLGTQSGLSLPNMPVPKTAFLSTYGAGSKTSLRLALKVTL